MNKSHQTRYSEVKVTLSMPDAKALLSLLCTSDSFPDVVEELRERIAIIERDQKRRQ